MSAEKKNGTNAQPTTKPVRRYAPAETARRHGPGPGRGPGGPHGGMMPHGKPKNAKGTLKRLSKYLAARWGLLALVLLFSLISTVISIVGTRINGSVLDDYVSTGDLSGLAVICLILAGIYLVAVACSYFQNVVMVHLANRTVAGIRKDLFSEATRLPLKFFDSHSSGDLMSRMTNDIDTIGMTLSQSVAQLFGGVMMLVGVLIAMLVLSPMLTLIGMITVPIMFLLTRGVAKISRKYFKLQAQDLGDLNGYIEESISGQKTIKIFSHEAAAEKEFSEYNRRLRHSGTIAQSVSGCMGPFMNLINNLSYLIVAVAGGYMIVGNAGVTVGMMFSFIGYMKNFSRPLSEIANLFNTFQSALAGAERVFEIMDEGKETDAPGAAEAETFHGGVRFEDVTFSYEPGKPVLQHANIDVHSGQQIAIVGPTGAGKTTIISLLTRFYEVDSGRILIDGKPIDSITRRSLRRNVGMVLQDTYLFSETVRDNIRYSRPDATDDEVEQAARLANAHGFIRHMPQGYDTVLQDNGSNLSQGQRQLLAIARAILADPAILILDEATSSIDTRTELKIQQAMLTLMQGRTSFIIAHRLSTIRGADCILVINHGEIVERGTHDELLQAGGFYANLYNSQFKTGLAL